MNQMVCDAHRIYGTYFNASSGKRRLCTQCSAIDDPPVTTAGNGRNHYHYSDSTDGLMATTPANTFSKQLHNRDQHLKYNERPGEVISFPSRRGQWRSQMRIHCGHEGANANGERLNCCNIHAKKWCFVFFSFRSRMLEPSVLTKKITRQQTCCECSCSEILRFDLQDTTTLILWSITSTSRFRRITPQLLLLRSYHPLLRIFPTRQIT